MPSVFSSVTDARQQLVEALGDPEIMETPLSTAEIEQILTHLAPQVWIAPGEGLEDRIGGTRFGGAPDLPGGMAWPKRAVPGDLAARALQLHDRQAWILRHIERELPYEFLAQIDLAETSRAAGLGLPASGRLLFFWDGVGGLMFSEPAFARVLWDDTPPERLYRAAIPPAMEELERAYDPTGRFKKPYVYPARPMRLEPILHLPFADASEMRDDPALAGRIDELEFRECYDGLLRGESGWLKRKDGGQRRQRLRGTPEPLQDDPRIEAAYHGPGDWQLLLQLDLADLAQNSIGEGTLFFVISDNKLAACDFSEVRAIYDQT
jgi:hypothetical protein